MDHMLVKFEQTRLVRNIQKFNLKTIIFQCSKNYDSPTRVTRLKVAPNMAVLTKRDYSLNDSPSNTEMFWYDALNVDDDVDWGIIHENNFNCSIETQLRAFYFKIFHNTICTNTFLAKIGKSDSPFCHFCKKKKKKKKKGKKKKGDETLVHMFCECKKISPLWDDLVSFIQNNTGDSLNV